MDFISMILNSKFMQEPAWRWFVFLGLILVSLIVWRAVLDEMS